MGEWETLIFIKTDDFCYCIKSLEATPLLLLLFCQLLLLLLCSLLSLLSCWLLIFWARFMFCAIHYPNAPAKSTAQICGCFWLVNKLWECERLLLTFQARSMLCAIHYTNAPAKSTAQVRGCLWLVNMFWEDWAATRPVGWNTSCSWWANKWMKTPNFHQNR